MCALVYGNLTTTKDLHKLRPLCGFRTAFALGPSRARAPAAAWLAHLHSVLALHPFLSLIHFIVAAVVLFILRGAIYISITCLGFARRLPLVTMAASACIELQQESVTRSLRSCESSISPH